MAVVEVVEVPAMKAVGEPSMEITVMNAIAMEPAMEVAARNTAAMESSMDAPVMNTAHVEPTMKVAATVEPTWM